MASERVAAAELVGHGIEASKAYGRPDLALRLEAVLRSLEDPTIRVVVIGEFKQGKSSLVNALVGQEVCPIDDDIATAVPTAVAYAEHHEAFAVLEHDDGTERREAIELESVRDWVTDTGTLADRPGLRRVELGVPSGRLRDGLVLVDMPGVGGVGSFHGAAALAEASRAHGVLFASEASQELTAPELRFLADAAGCCPNVALVKTKCDIHPAWRRSVERDREHLGEQANLVQGVSTVVFDHALKVRQGRVVAESGLPGIANWLRDDVIAPSGARDVAAAASQVADVCEQLRMSFEAERAALSESVDPAALEAQLGAARDEAARLRTAATRWQQVLGDVFTDVTGDAEHAVADQHSRSVTRAEAAIDQIDPATSWAVFEPALRRELTGLVSEHHATLQASVTHAGELAAAVFDEDLARVADLVEQAIPTDSELPARLDAPAELGKAKRMRVPGQALTFAKATYGPSLMVGFGASLLGMTVAAPVMLAVGSILGGKSLLDEKARQLGARRAQAKATARRFVDDVVLEVGKTARDEARRAQRLLRDHLAARAEELLQAANVALTVAQRAHGSDAATWDQRRTAVDAELQRLAWLDARAIEVRMVVT